MELYDATAGREFSVLDYLFNPNSTLPVSSFTPTIVGVQTQSFFSRLVPKSAAITRTEQGITAKQVLLVTNTDQVTKREGRRDKHTGVWMALRVWVGSAIVVTMYIVLSLGIGKATGFTSAWVCASKHVSFYRCFYVQVYALDRRWVDPRRPKKQKLTQDEMEEGLVPYQVGIS